MSKKKFGTVILAAMLSASLLAGCGGNDTPVSGTVSTPGGTGAAGVGASSGASFVTGESTAATGGTGESGAAGQGGKTSNGQIIVTTKGGAANPGTKPNDSDANKIIEGSFTRLPDGTCKDKETGVIFLDDDLDNYTKTTYKRGTSLQTDSNEAALMEGDSVRVLKGSDYKEAWFSYELDAGITEVGLVAYYAQEDNKGNFKEGLTLQVSKDHNTWTTLKPQTQDTSLGFGWYKRVYIVKGIDKANKYFKVQFNAPTGISYNPNVGRLRINNVDKMNDPDRYLENRASATYYVDAKKGNDQNDGLSPEKPFKSLFKVSSKFYQPGDKVLFKKGETYGGSLNIKGYGTASSPIQFGTYGEGDKPLINGRTTGGAAVTIKATYITFDGFEVTNSNGRIGINVIPAQAGANKNITISNCYIHDVNKNELDFTYEKSGGIIVYADNVEPVWFDGMKVTNNTIENTSRMGILYTTQWAWRPGRWGKNETGEHKYVNDDKNWFVFLNSSITNNTLVDIGGDGIMACGAKDLLIERNVVYNAYSTEKPANYATAAAGLWTTNTNNSIIQYNEVGYTQLPPGGTDGDGYDIDISEVNTTLQYNYSHNNEGGFLLICNFGDGYKVSKNATVRYNLSVDDGGVGNTGFMIITNKNPGTHIYNNTFYSSITDRNVSMIHFFGESPEDFTFSNNIFAGIAGNQCNWTSAGTESKNFKFVNNIFAGVPEPNFGEVTGSKVMKAEDLGFKKLKGFSEKEYKDMDAMIANFKPTKLSQRPSFISGDPKKDIAGKALSQAIYGAVQY